MSKVVDYFLKYVASEQSLTQNLLHVVELTACICHLPEDEVDTADPRLSAFQALDNASLGGIVHPGNHHSSGAYI